MIKLRFEFFLILISFSCILSSSTNVTTDMEKNEIVPDIIDVAPKNLVEIKYPCGAVVNLGNELTPTQVKDIPCVITWEADENQLYTLLFTDPDAISRKNPTLRESRHWLVVNIPGNNITKGQTLVEYLGSGPPKDTGLHRYVFLIFQQSQKIESNTFVSKRSIDGRIRTSTRALISDFHLGDPIAGNFYQAQYDDYVPILIDQIGGPPKIE